MHERFYSVISIEIFIESFAVTYMAAVTRAVLFHSEIMGSGFHANEHPELHFFVSLYDNGPPFIRYPWEPSIFHPPVVCI